MKMIRNMGRNMSLAIMFGVAISGILLASNCNKTVLIPDAGKPSAYATNEKNRKMLGLSLEEVLVRMGDSADKVESPE